MTHSSIIKGRFAVTAEAAVESVGGSMDAPGPSARWQVCEESMRG